MADNVFSPRVRWHKLTTAIILGWVCAVCAILIGLNNVHRLRLIINQMAWESTRPTAYYMVVDENWVPKGHWLWAVSVQGERSTGVKLLESRQLSPSWDAPSGPTVATIEKAFEFGQGCARSLLDCRLQFDPQYHYPRGIGFSDGYEIEVKQFTPCGASADSCPSVGELPVK